MSWGLGALSGIGNMVDSFWHPESGYEDAVKQMMQSWKQGQGFQMPFQQAGAGQIPKLTGAQDRLMDPSGLLDEWMNKYQMSPYAKRSFDNAKEAGLDAASSMGMMGSSAATNNIQQSASDIMNADRQQYLNDMMEKYMKGIGIGQDIFGKGAATAGNLGEQGLRAGEDISQGKFGARTAPGEMLKNLLSMGAKMWMQGQS